VVRTAAKFNCTICVAIIRVRVNVVNMAAIEVSCLNFRSGLRPGKGE